jgi:hypothetical protein
MRPLQYHIPFPFSASLFQLIAIDTKEVSCIARLKRKTRYRVVTITALPVSFKAWAIAISSVLLPTLSISSLCVTVTALKTICAARLEWQLSDRFTTNTAGPIPLKCCHDVIT